MKTIVSTHQGNLYNEQVEYIVVKSSEGEFAILEDHIPVISVIDEGFIKLVRAENQFYVAVVNGLVEFHDNVATVLVQEAYIGKTESSAKKYLEEFRKERLEKNRKEEVDLTQKEKELRENIKRSRAGQL